MGFPASLLKASFLLTAAAFAACAMAQSDYPTKSIRLVVPFAPGGSAEQAGRVLAQKLGEQMGHTVIVDNKPGANSDVGNNFVAQAQPDGYTVLYNTSSLVFNIHIQNKVNYDISKEFSPIALTATVPQILVVHPSVPARNLQEFISYVRANNGKLNYCSVGIGNIGHLTTVLFLNAHNLKAEHIPYNGGSQSAYIDLIAGRTQFYFATVSGAVPFIKDNRVRPIAVTSLQRTKALPDVPTIDESGMPKFEATAWQGMLVPAKTPAAIVAKLNAEVMKALKNPDLLKQFDVQGTIALGSTPAEYGAYLKNENERWGKIIRAEHIKPES